MAKYRFDEIAFNSTEKKKPVEEDRFTYIGLEHLDPGTLQVTRFGSDVAPKGEKLLMKEGDVLFGKRRAYQKKVGIAPFDGIFSAHGMVLRPQEEIIDKDFFPLFISSDYFLDAAIKISVGSLSPTINWRDLKILEFELPSLTVQRDLAKVLSAINVTMESYKKLIMATELLVKSQFIDQFASVPKLELSKVALITMGQSPASSTYNDKGEGMPFYQGKTEFGEKYVSTKMYCSDPKKKAEAGDVLLSVRAPVGSVNITLDDCCIGRGLASIRGNEGKTHSEFLFYALRTIEDEIAAMGQGATFKAINKEQLYTVMVPDASKEEQEMFVDFVKQSDKSKFELEKSIKELDLLYKKIIKENLG